MNPGPIRRLAVSSRARLLLSLLAATLLVAAPRYASGQTITSKGTIAVPSRGAPSQSYFRLFGNYYDGSYKDAADGFNREGRGAIKNVAVYWIDSICYHTMAGECYYQMGQYGPALDHYDQACQLYLTYFDWMLRVQFSPTLRAAQASQLKLCPWGATTRVVRIASFPDAMQIAQGKLDNMDVVRGGGVVQAPVLFSINVQEIVRCTTLAIRRRREIMGPACEHSQITKDLVIALTKHPTLPNHWSEAWTDTELGVALEAAGKPVQARTVLQRAIVAGGEFDHPLTSTVLLELGRLSMEQADFGSAARFFEEASYAAFTYPDPGVVEESLRLGALNHLLSNAPGPYPPLAAAAEWARVKDLRQLRASMLIAGAENQCVLGNTAVGMKLAETAKGVIGRREMGAGRTGARLNYVYALGAFQQGNLAAGNAALAAALDFQRIGSLWLFQIGLVDKLKLNGLVSDRTALDLYAAVLRDPTAADWLSDPLEAMASLAVPHYFAFEHWFDVASKNGTESALEVADMARRHRFLNSMEFGGRLLNLRLALTQPDEALDQRTLLDRQALLTRYPRFEQLALQSRQLRDELEKMPLVPTDAPVVRHQADLFAKLATVSQAQEAVLREMAVRREACATIFPPRMSVKELRNQLKPREGLLVFFATQGELHGFLMNSDKYATWKVGSPAVVHKKISTLLRSMGNYESNREIDSAELADTKWKDQGSEILVGLTSGSNANLPQLFDELTIVPDASLWYLPFEALPVSTPDGPRPLISKVRVRYAPTMGLAVPSGMPRRSGGTTGVALGKLFPRDDESVATSAFERLSRAVPKTIAIGPVQAPSGTYVGLFNRLVVLADIPAPTAGALSWSPLPAERGSGGGTLGSWMSLPAMTPEAVILPGFHTPAENALRNQGWESAGTDLFLSTCAMMATGTRTILISRWRTGGETSYNLIREFAQELPHSTAAEAWQRSVLVVSELPLTPGSEPRLKRDPSGDLPTAEHPFFWSGYMLVDDGSPPYTDDEDPAARILKMKKGAAAKAAAVNANAAKGAANALKNGAANKGAKEDVKPLKDEDPKLPGLKPDAKARGAKRDGASKKGDALKPGDDKPGAAKPDGDKADAKADDGKPADEKPVPGFGDADPAAKPADGKAADGKPAAPKDANLILGDDPKAGADPTTADGDQPAKKGAKAKKPVKKPPTTRKPRT